jgi:ATP-dependent helicase HepA
MVLQVVGQRWVSEREPELGLGRVVSVDASRIGVEFPATQEKRLYARGTPVLKRVQFGRGETIRARDGTQLVVEAVQEIGGLLVYEGQGRRVPEDELSDVTSVSSPAERLMAGQVDPGEVFDLRRRALEAQARFQRSDVRGFLGGRVELIPHQMYILQEVAARQIPRVLLADEVGLGKTIEACLILQRLLAVGRARRVLVLVPESLVHQWFVELLRRFNLWFSIYDEDRCAAVEASDPGQNPFDSSQLALSSMGFLAAHDTRRAQAVAAGWDMVVVDEAHHLAWSAEEVSPEYQLVEELGRCSPGLLLLTATPTQLGLTGHFARLRLIDPHRFNDFDRFVSQSEHYGAVAAVAEKLLEHQPLTARDRRTLQQLFEPAPEHLEPHWRALEQDQPGARDALLKLLVDRHGTGRVVFRNTRAAMKGFPPRRFCPEPLPLENPALATRLARELKAEETGGEAGVRYHFKDDPRIAWLSNFLQRHRQTKLLLICRSQRKVAAIEAALQERINARVALFHEGLPLVQRDRQAAWFAEPDGAQLMLASEIGSEGRNFQFAHHLVLFDLPLNPGLIEQRIGRLDRIGQTETIRIHVPYVEGTGEECLVEWYHRGLAAFSRPLHGGSEYEAQFKTRLLDLAVVYGSGPRAPGRRELDALVEETAAFRAVLARRLQRGRDRLLELNSFRPAVAQRLIERIRETEADPHLPQLLIALLDHFGVRIKEHEEGDLFLDPSHAYVEAFPSIPADGMLATFRRERAIVREDIRFLTADHPLVQDAIDLLVDSPRGTTAFGFMRAPERGLLLEVMYQLETVADSRWHVDQFLPATPVRVVVDARAEDRTSDWPAITLATEVVDAPIERFLDRPGFTGEWLKSLLAGAAEVAEERALGLRQSAAQQARAALDAELQRLIDLQRVNDQVRPEEVELSRLQLERTQTAIVESRLRLDSLRLVVLGPDVKD